MSRYAKKKCSHIGSGYDNEEPTLGLGIRGLWRKGQEKIEEHRRRANMSANPREERAAAVVQF